MTGGQKKRLKCMTMLLLILQTYIMPYLKDKVQFRLEERLGIINDKYLT